MIQRMWLKKLIQCTTLDEIFDVLDAIARREEAENGTTKQNNRTKQKHASKKHKKTRGRGRGRGRRSGRGRSYITQIQSSENNKTTDDKSIKKSVERKKKTNSKQKYRKKTRCSKTLMLKRPTNLRKDFTSKYKRILPVCHGPNDSYFHTDQTFSTRRQPFRMVSTSADEQALKKMNLDEILARVQDTYSNTQASDSDAESIAFQHTN